MTIAYWQGPKGKITKPESGDFGTGSNWSNGAVPDGGVDAVFGDGHYTVTVEQSDLTLNSFSIGAGATVILDQDSDITLSTTDASINSGTLICGDIAANLEGGLTNYGEIDAGGNGDFSNDIGGTTLTNYGVIDNRQGASTGLVLDVENAAQGKLETTGGGELQLLDSITNDGTLEALNGGTISNFENGFGTTGTITNLSDGTLSGGTWIVETNSLIDFQAAAITTLGSGATVILDGLASQFEIDTDGTASEIEQTLTQIDAGATLAMLDGRDYMIGDYLKNSGTITLGGGVISSVNSSESLDGYSGSLLSGYGLIDAVSAFADGSEVRADRNPDDRHATLAFTADAFLETALTGDGTLELRAGTDYLLTNQVSVRNLLLDGADVKLGENFSYRHDLTISAGTLDVQDTTLTLAGKTTLGAAMILGTHGEGALRLTGSLTVTGHAAIESPTFINDGTVTVAKSLEVDTPVTGKGKFVIGAGGTLAFDLVGGDPIGKSQTVEFSGKHAELKLGYVPAFHGLISGFAGTDSIDLNRYDFAHAKFSFAPDHSGAGGTLTVRAAGEDKVTLRFADVDRLSDLHFATDHAGGTLISYAGSASAAHPASGFDHLAAHALAPSIAGMMVTHAFGEPHLAMDHLVLA